jgi:hypothetical protein
MSQIAKGIALVVVVVCLVWLGVLWQWEATHRVVAIEDIVIYLALLPLVVFGLVLLLRWAWRAAVARQAATGAASLAAAAALASGQGNSKGSAELPQAEAAERHLRVQLLASALNSSCGQSGREVLAALKEGRPMPELDKQLRDDDGLPVMCARLSDLPKLDTQAALATVQAKNEAWHTLEPGEHVQRALAALSEPLALALMSLQPWQQHFEADPQRRLRVLLAWPQDWSEFEQAFADAWASAWLQEHAPPFAQSAWRITQSARQGGVALWRLVDHLMLAMAREKRDDAVLVAACHSDISAEAVERLEREQRLFSAPRRPKGDMPGEAAAAMLLAGADWPKQPDKPDDPGPVQLHRAAFMQRDKAVDGDGRISSEVLQGAISNALVVAKLGAEDVPALVCDADRHSARCGEVLGASMALMPKLDVALDVALLATPLGHTGAVGVLLSIATAAATASRREAPCLVLGVAEPLGRLALVLRPAADPASGPASLESPAA